MEFYTIGVYHSTEQEYFKKLTDNHIDTFCDIRQLRGVRGSQYIFANSKRLQEKLKNLNIQYWYVSDLAPTTEIRELQKEADVKFGTSIRERNELDQTFANAYRNKILTPFDFEDFIEQLTKSNAFRVVLFCVEENPKACHRSIVTDKLSELGYHVTHL